MFLSRLDELSPVQPLLLCDLHSGYPAVCQGTVDNSIDCLFRPVNDALCNELKIVYASTTIFSLFQEVISWPKVVLLLFRF